jgi:hypothetical protein
MLMFDPTNDWPSGVGSLHAMRSSTVLTAALAARGIAAWQLILSAAPLCL